MKCEPGSMGLNSLGSGSNGSGNSDTRRAPGGGTIWHVPPPPAPPVCDVAPGFLISHVFGIEWYDFWRPNVEIKWKFSIHLAYGGGANILPPGKCHGTSLNFTFSLKSIIYPSFSLAALFGALYFKYTVLQYKFGQICETKRLKKVKNFNFCKLIFPLQKVRY